MDQQQLAAAFDAQRSRLRAVAYRILGSLSESDDAVQDSWLRLQRTDTATIENLDAWLTTVTARISLNLLRARHTISEHPLDAFSPEPIVSMESGDDPEYEALLADAVGIALQVVLDTLAPAERLAFVLHDMFAVPFSDIAAILDRTPGAARQLASRARRQIRDAAPEPEPDMKRQVAVLDPDVVLRAHRRGEPPLELHGAEQVSRGAMIARPLASSVRPALINGTAGVIAYQNEKPFAILAFTVVLDRAVAIDVFNDSELVPLLVRTNAGTAKEIPGRS
jgi:RNA polymerase sigma factor (sigma-70 family)